MLGTTTMVILGRAKFIQVDPSHLSDGNFWAVMWMIVWERPRSAQMGNAIEKHREQPPSKYQPLENHTNKPPAP